LGEDFKASADREERARAASAISNLAKGWVSLQDAKREILGRPRAGVRRPQEEPRRRRARFSPQWREPEPLGVPAEPVPATDALPTAAGASSQPVGG
jgi:hypothetical protein